MSGAVGFSTYGFGEREEHCLTAGDSPAILIVPPLFDEMNRMRRTLALLMRALADMGAGSVMPDLPGTNESLMPPEEASLDLWRDAIAEAAKAHGAKMVASFRGGALVDDGAGLPLWRFAPAKGRMLLRTLLRVRIASDKENRRTTTAEELMESAKREPLALAGNILSPAMVAQLDAAEPAAREQCRVVQLKGSGKDADAEVGGRALWLGAEPGESSILAEEAAADIYIWMRKCGVS